MVIRAATSVKSGEDYATECERIADGLICRRKRKRREALDNEGETRHVYSTLAMIASQDCTAPAALQHGNATVRVRAGMVLSGCGGAVGRLSRFTLARARLVILSASPCPLGV